MAKTYAEIRKQIAALEAQAEKQRGAEVAEVVQKIRVAIETYGLTQQDLFEAKAAKGVRRAYKRPTKPKYADDKGNTWVGLGKRPQWIRDALSAGAKLEDFLGGKSGAAPTLPADAPSASGPNGIAARKKKQSGKVTAKKATKAKFSDGAGNSWSGRGPKPKWIKEALAAGKKLEDLAA
jgi:DNA-binding protein H-NS